MNKTIKIFLLLISIILFCNNIFSQSLSGNYTIGGTSPNYLTLNAAVTDLVAKGVNGPVNFKIRSGEYIEHIEISEFAGSSKTNIVTFESETGNKEDVTIAHSHSSSSEISNFTIKLVGGDNLVFKNITIQSIKLQDGKENHPRVIHILKNSDNISFFNNNIKAWLYTDSPNEENSCIGIENDSNDSITFYNNEIIGGATAIYNYGVNYLYVENNKFTKQKYYTIYLDGASNIRIVENNIHQINPSLNNPNIYLMNTNDSLLVSKNRITLEKASTGIAVRFTSKTNHKKVISNNIINILSGASDWALGIQTEYNDTTVDIIHNTVNINSKNGLCVFSLNDKSFLKNNQLINNSGGYCVELRTPINVQTEFNNVFNYTTSNLYKVDNAIYNTISNIQGIGYESNSYSYNPYFYSLENPIPYNGNLYLGEFVDFITDDIWGNSRLTTTTIGAIEVASSIQNDASLLNFNLENSTICPNENINLSIEIKNNSTNNLTQATIVCEYNGSPIINFPWSGNLSQGQSELVQIGTHNFSSGSFDLVIYSTLPNNFIDDVPMNDTVKVQKITSLKGEFTVGNATSDYSTLLSAIKDLQVHGVCGPVTLKLTDGYHTDHYIFENINGLSATNTLTIESLSGDSSKVKFYNYYCPEVNGLSHITFRNVTFYTQFSYTVLKINKSSNVKIHNCLVNASQTGGSLENFYIFNSSDILIQDNLFRYGGYPIAIYYSDGITIKNNSFQEKVGGTLKLSKSNNILFTKNSVKNGSFATNPLFYFKDTCNNVEIKSNNIDGSRIFQFENFTTIPNAEIKIYNNMIISNNQFCKLTNSENVKIVNNSIYSYGNTSNIIEFLYSNKNIEFKNNSVLTGLSYMFYSYNSLPTNFISDYNILYTTKTDFAYWTTPISKSDWQTTYNNDLNSSFSSPEFVSTTDLHANNSSLMSNLGTPISYVTTDFDGEIRDALTPDIGADEFVTDSTSFLDLYISELISPDTTSCFEPQDSLIIEVYNASPNVVTNFDVAYRIYGVLHDSSTYIIRIPPYSSQKVNLGYLYYSPKTMYSIDIELFKPNGSADNNSINNSIEFDYYYIDSVKIIKDINECNGQIELYLENHPRSSILWSNGSSDYRILNAISPQTYTISITDYKGCIYSDTIVVE